MSAPDPTPNPPRPPKLASLEDANAVMAMLFKDQQELRRQVGLLAATTPMMLAAWATALEAINAVAERAGVTEVDGVPLDDWVEGRVRANTEKQLARAEDIDPAMAAHWQATLDKWYFNR